MDFARNNKLSSAGSISRRVRTGTSSKREREQRRKGCVAKICGVICTKTEERERAQVFYARISMNREERGVLRGEKGREQREDERKAMNKVESISSPVTNGGGKRC